MAWNADTRNLTDAEVHRTSCACLQCAVDCHTASVGNDEQCARACVTAATALLRWRMTDAETLTHRLQQCAAACERATRERSVCSDSVIRCGQQCRRLAASLNARRPTPLAAP